MRDYRPSCPEPTFQKGMLRTHTQTVLPDWIDYNGHMNVAFYTKAFDTAFDEVLEDYFGIGVTFVERSCLGPMSLQSNFFYLEELLEGEKFYVNAFLVDCDAKRMHFFVRLSLKLMVVAPPRLKACRCASTLRPANRPSIPTGRRPGCRRCGRRRQTFQCQRKWVRPSASVARADQPCCFVNGAQQLTIVGSFWQQSSIRYPINPPIAAKSTR